MIRTTEELVNPEPSHAASDALFAHHPVPLWVYDRTNLQFLAVNDAAIAQYGYTRDEFLSMTIVDIRTDADDAEVRRLLANPGRRRAWRQSGVFKYRTRGGAVVHAEVTSHDLIFEGRPAVAVAAYDVTERLNAEAAARDAERRLNEAQRLAQLGSWHWDCATDCVSWSDELFRIAEREKQDGVPGFANQRALYAPEDWAPLTAAVDRTLRTGEPFELQVAVVRPDGSRRIVVARGAAIRDASGTITALHGTGHDVTERSEREARLRQTDNELHASEARYRDLIENLDDVVFVLDVDGTIRYSSPAVEHYGYTSTELIGRPFSSVMHPDDCARAVTLFHESLSGSWDRKPEFKVVDKHGQPRIVRSSARVQCRDGVPVSVIGVLMDVTEQRRAQEQLRTAGRLEAVGRLASGIAHDFNNLLVAINGFAELALASTPESSPIRNDIAEIIKAGDRAAALTSQLLAFSRRQELRPDCVHLCEVVKGMEPMLRRLIGEDIELVVECEPDPNPVRIDTSHLEQMVMNLVVNARDAMPEGGTLRITTSSGGFPERELPAGVTADKIAVLTVSDTGCGMDEPTQQQIFEPFFTTKPLGQGTGLGLAMVYGFVKQSGGAISVASAPGEGATFRIALPHQHANVSRLDDETARVEPGTETVLIAEDDGTVRMLLRRLLHAAGYTVLTAASPETALQMCQTYEGTIDVLLTDVVMPQMSGLTLANHAKNLRPEMSVLFMSGYTGTELSAHGLSESHGPLLHKPFTTAALSEAIRTALAE